MISARLLIGGAGTGKTRLAFELLLRVNVEKPEWRSGVLSGSDLRRLVEKTHTPDFNWPLPTLLVVDYAQTLAAPLKDLLLALTHKRAERGTPLRLLLLERQPGDWFDDLLRVEESHGPCAIRDLFDPPAPILLSPLPKGTMRRQILRQTLDRAGRLAGQAPITMPQPDDAAFANSLNRSLFDQPLNLMLAALAAGELGLHPALGRERIELAETLAERELRRIGRFARDPQSHAQKRALRHLAACATMERGITAQELVPAVTEELGALSLAWPGGPGDAAAVLKEALSHERLSVGPVEPDFVGEALVLMALASPNGSAGDSNKDWQAAVLRCCKRDPHSTPATLLHAFQNFGHNKKYGGLLLAATDALIGAGVADTELDLLLGIENALPHQTVELRLRAVEVTLHLYKRMKARARKEDDSVHPQLAGLANNLGLRLAQAGRLAEALSAAEQAVKLYRSLAEQNPDAFLPHLGMSLNNLASRLSELGRRTEALSPAEEAVIIYRRLAAQNPDAFLPGLAMSLNNLTGSLSKLGRRTEALSAAEEAVKFHRRLAEKNPDGFLPDLAASLNNLANRLSGLGRRADALSTAEEAVKIGRHLADQYPDAFLPGLAVSLNNLAKFLSELGRPAEALNPAEEAVEIRRSLAGQNPDAFLPDLAMSLNNLANFLSELGRRAEALSTGEEAVKLDRHLTEQNPDASLPDLAMSLNNLANFLSGLGQPAEALSSTEEAVDILRRLAAQNPDAFAQNLAVSLGAKGNVLRGMKRHVEAMGSYAEGIGALRARFEAFPKAFAPLMAALVRNCLRTGETAGMQPDRDLIEPVVEQLQLMKSDEEGGQEA